MVAILMDRPNGDGWAHLVSDQPGFSGREELRSFAKGAFLPHRRHRTGTYGEHYDIRGDEVQRALNAGARFITRRELALLLRKKRLAERGNRTIIGGPLSPVSGFPYVSRLPGPAVKS